MKNPGFVIGLLLILCIQTGCAAVPAQKISTASVGAAAPASLPKPAMDENDARLFTDTERLSEESGTKELTAETILSAALRTFSDALLNKTKILSTADNKSTYLSSLNSIGRSSTL